MAFLDIVKNQRKQGTGILSSLSMGARQSSLEKMDPRNRLFKSGTLLNALFPNVKGYKADSKSSDNVKSTPSSLSSVNSVSELSIRLDVIGKNTLVLPSMARDFYLVKQNMIKLVKLQGGTPQTKSGDWFSRQQARENAYEARYNKTKTSPSKVEKKEQSGGFLSGLLSIIGGAASIFGGFLSTFSFAGNLLLTFGTVLARVLGWLVRSPIGVLLGLGALLGVKSLMSDSNNTGTGGNKTSGGGSSIMNDVVKSDTTKTVVDTAAGVGGAMAAGGAVSAISKGVGVAKTTGEAILDARTMSVGQMANSSPKTTWGKFLAFVARKSPALWGRVALKLAQAGALAAIPIVGWIGAAIQLGFSLWTAWEIYELWKEFNSMHDEAKKNTSPEQMSTNLTDLIAGRTDNGGFKFNHDTPMNQQGNPSTGPSGRGIVTGKYGEWRGNHMHAGVDLAKPIGTPVYATKGGTVKYSGEGTSGSGYGGYGRTIEIDHGDGTSTLYAHLDKRFVQSGAVQAGQQIGTVGNTGNVKSSVGGNGSHLHYEERKNGKAVPVSSSTAQLALLGNTSTLAKKSASNMDSLRAELQSTLGINGFKLNSFSSELLNSQRKSSQSSPVNIDARTSNNTNNGGGGGQISLPASGVIDNELAKLLVERAIG